MNGWLVLVAMLFATSLPAAERTLTFSQPAHGLETVTVEVGAGDITVTGCDCSEITAAVTVTGKRWQLEELELDATRNGKTLRLSLSPRKYSGKKAGEDWTLKLPRQLSLSVEAGVGDVRIQGMNGELEVELGVGDVVVTGLVSNLTAETGVGDVEVRGSWTAVGRMRLTTGVGSVTVHTPEGKLSGQGLVSESLVDKGPGQAKISVTTGVGDITLRLLEQE
ncbi:MAG: toast rack family protein [Thermoanaerobaculum sp.]